MDMQDKIIKLENKSIETILEEVESCITDIKKRGYSERAEKSEGQQNWLDNKLKEWELIKEIIELLKERTTILGKVTLKKQSS